jgi:transcriptional regulator with XRE-family HTH domain
LEEADMNNDDGSFGATVRRLREERKIGLRKFAEMVGMSPTYLSKVERDDFNPPSEEKVRAIAQALGQDADELLALAGRVSADLANIIQRHPREMATFLRAANGLSAEEMQRLAEEARRLRKDEDA